MAEAFGGKYALLLTPRFSGGSPILNLAESTSERDLNLAELGWISSFL